MLPKLLKRIRWRRTCRSTDAAIRECYLPMPSSIRRPFFVAHQCAIFFVSDLLGLQKDEMWEIEVKEAKRLVYDKALQDKSLYASILFIFFAVFLARYASIRRISEENQLFHKFLINHAPTSDPGEVFHQLSTYRPISEEHDDFFASALELISKAMALPYDVVKGMRFTILAGGVLMGEMKASDSLESRPENEAVPLLREYGKKIPWR